MNVSYTWLQTHFKEPLPAAEKIAELLTFHVFEIESIETKNNDTVLDVKVLPDRACYALSHYGIAYELAAITKLPLQEKKNPTLEFSSRKKVVVTIEDQEGCDRYSACFVEDITVGPSPAWLQERLESVGQRSINTVVDATNVVMLDCGQPLHAFDADKVKGNIVIRRAHEGEKIELLPEKALIEGQTVLKERVIILNKNDLVITDDEGPIALAGIKGGLRASVTESTKNLIIESAHFNASRIRKTSTIYNLRNDSSKRFENNLSPEKTLPAMKEVLAILNEIATPHCISPITDIYPIPQQKKSIVISQSLITDRLGLEIAEKDIEDIFNRLSIGYNRKNSEYVLTIPPERMDLNIPQDIVEEVGRIYGYDKLPSVSLPSISFKPKIHKEFYYIDSIKNILVDLFGFSEVMTYAFVSHGEVEMEKPLAADKKYLRKDIATQLAQSLELNARNADLLGLDQIKIFEIGKVFSKEKESLSLALGIKNIKKTKKKEGEELKEIIEKMGLKLEQFTVHTNVLEIDLGTLISTYPDPTVYEPYQKQSETKAFKPISIYPFSVRDIAVFTPEGTQEHEVRTIIEKEAGALLVKNRLFDVFTKENKTSYAFRMVFQSYEKTLTEEEINTVMNAITTTMNSKEGWKVR